MLGLVGEIVGLAGAEMPGALRQVELARPQPKGGADKQPLPAGEPCPRCGEAYPVVDFVLLVGPPIGDGAARPQPAIRAVAGRYLEGDGERVVVVVGWEPHLAIDVDAIPDDASPDHGPDIERERSFDQGASVGSHGPYYQIPTAKGPPSR